MASLSRWMEQVWGAFTWNETGTDKENGVLFLYKGDSKVRSNRSGAQNLISFSLSVPLGIMELRPASDRHWNLVAQEVTVPDWLLTRLRVHVRFGVTENLKSGTGGPVHLDSGARVMAKP